VSVQVVSDQQPGEHQLRFCQPSRELRRSAWTSLTPTRLLFDSLLADFSLRAAGGQSAEHLLANPRSHVDYQPLLEQMLVPVALQHRAMLRLLYYFPKQTAALVSARLDGLDVSGPDEWSGNINLNELRAVVANGADPQELIASSTWCTEPLVQQALQRVFLRTTDRPILLSTVIAMENHEGTEVL